MRSIKEIRNGSLYYNERRNQVERVLGTVNSQRVWTKRHQQKCDEERLKNLRLADTNEVTGYIKESELQTV